MMRKLILIVDDHNVNRSIMKCALEKDFDIAEAEDGVQALNLLTTLEVLPELIITDIRMPEMNGFELLEKLKTSEKFSQIPVIVVTEMNDPESEIQALDLGAMDLIKKPYDIRLLYRRSANVIMRRASEKMARQLEKRVQYERFMLLMEKTNDAVFDYDIKTDNFYFFAHHPETGQINEKIKPRYLAELVRSQAIHPDDLETYRAILTGQDETTTLEFRTCDADGMFYWARAYFVAIKDDTQRPLRILGRIENINREQKLQKRLEEAEIDDVTGIPGRAAAIRKIQSILEKGQISDHKTMIIFDLDNFKEINDAFGHIAGDRVLREVAKAISKQFRSSDVVGRLGGDEFLAFLYDTSDTKVLEQKMNRIMDEVFWVAREFFPNITVSISAGIAMTKDHKDTFKDLYANADQALYDAKKSGKNCFVFYNEM